MLRSSFPPVEVGDIDGVHVDDGDIGDGREGEVLEQLAAQAAGTNDENLELLLQQLRHLAKWKGLMIQYLCFPVSIWSKVGVFKQEAAG